MHIFKVMRLVLSASSIVFLSACVAEPSTILKKVDLTDTRIVTTDAKQRAIVSTEIGIASRPGLVDPHNINCTEPSPDVASSVANSLSTGVSVLGYGSGSLSVSAVEALAQLVERTATIQLLRDKMYQTCLAYANGAISGTTYSLVMSQLDKTIVSLLLGESAAGRFGRSLAALGTEAQGEATATLVGLPAGVEEFSSLAEELKDAQADVAQKEQALSDKEKLAEGKPAESDEAKAVAAAQTELTKSKATRDELLKRLQSQADSLAKSSAKASNVVAGGGIGNAGGPASADILLEMQREFLTQGVSDFVITACYTELAVTNVIAEDAVLSKIRSALASAENGTETLAEIPNLKGASLLALFCAENLETTVTDINTKQQELAKLRISAETFAEERNLERARTARMVAFKEALAACEKQSDADIKKACLERVVEPPTVGRGS